MQKWEICYIRCEYIPLGTGPGNLKEWFAFAYVDEPGEKRAHLIYRSRRFDQDEETAEMFKLIEWLESQGWELPGGGRWTGGGFAPYEFRRLIP